MVKGEDEDEWLMRELGDAGSERRARSSRKTSAYAKPAGAEARQGSKKRGRILVVDDEAAMREVIRAILENEFDLYSTASGEEALEVLDSFVPDLLILDHILPGIKGIDLCSRIRSRQEFDSMKIIMVSGQTTLAERIDGFRAGADDFLVKPIQAADFLAKVRGAFEWKREGVGTERLQGRAVDKNGVKCWEYMKCGRKECPAYVQKAGRLCWLVAGTMCGGKVTGMRAQKLKSCTECEFFRLIRS